jgi:hypothetical protein
MEKQLGNTFIPLSYLMDCNKNKSLYCIEIYIDTNLEKPVKWDPEEENVSKELNQSYSFS